MACSNSIRCMDPDFYNAAAEGRIQVYKDASGPLNLLLTPIENTILHIYITYLHIMELGSKTKFVEAILDICPSLVRQHNTKGETPLHIAARYGHAVIVEVLIDRAKTKRKDLEDQSQVDPSKEMLRMTNQEGDTALHEAVRYNHLEVVKLLLMKDPNFSYSANKAGKTLLYIAVERGFETVAFEILDTSNSIVCIGPLGRTALHVATLRDDEGMIEEIIKKISGQTKQVDQKGFTPLHLAAGCGYLSAVKNLLEHDRQVAYMKDTEGRTALHIAAYEGYHETMKEIVSKCPDCCELVDNGGWNVLHFFVAKYHSPKYAVKLLQENQSLRNLLNERDFDGNTHFLLYSKTASLELLTTLIDDSSVDKMAFNNENLSACDMAMTSEIFPRTKRECIMYATGERIRRQVSFHGRPNFTHEIEKREGERGKSEIALYEKVGEYHLVVAALITTVTFAAGITTPGGFMGQDGPHPGSAILARSAAFKAFLIMDTITMLLSIVAVFAHMLLPAGSYNETPSAASFGQKMVAVGLLSTVVALGAMTLAFVTRTYAVLEQHSMGLAVAVCLIGLSFFPILILMLKEVAKLN